MVFVAAGELDDDDDDDTGDGPVLFNSRDAVKA
jgi:hypothetical protein